jgi:hypothetical protein
MKKNYVMVDYESVQPKSLDLLKPEHFSIRVFLGPTNTKLARGLVTAMQAMGTRAEYIELDVSAKNALDFHIAYYLGKLAAVEADAYFHVISRDQGFDPLITHLKSLGIFAARSESIEQMPCFVEASAKAKLATAAATDVVAAAITFLQKRKSARPAKRKTLLGSIHNFLGKERPIADAEALIAALVKRKVIEVVGEKVTYHLPDE